MPVYEYVCESCGIRFERFQHMSDTPLQECPECHGRVHRVVQPVGIIFKGSGFYVTDNRGKSSTLDKNNGETKEKAEAKGTKSSGESSSAENE